MRITQFLLMVLSLILVACTTRLDLVLPAPTLPIVYCQINPDDEVIYLTLTRTFSGDTNAYYMASNTEKVFFSNADIRLEAWVDEYKLNETNFEPLNRSKQSGPFPELPGYCFKFNSMFDQKDYRITQFRLIIMAPGMTTPAHSRIEVIGPPIIQSRYDHQISLYPNKYDIGIAPGSGVAYCDLKCVFRYKQFDGVWSNQSDTILLRRDIRFETGRTDYLYPELFFKRIAASLKPINDTIIRKFISLDLIMFSGDQHFRDYIDTYGNAGDLDLPPKGNIVNGLGLFTMVRTGAKTDMTLDRITFDSLCLGQYTKQLGFVRW